MSTAATLSRNVRRFRQARELSLNELARRSGISKQTVITIESGASNATVETLEALASTLEVSVRALLSELGSEVITRTSDQAAWRAQGNMHVRQLDQAFGSGYVFNAVLRLEANRGPSRVDAASVGSLRHCFALDGQARVGPTNDIVMMSMGDFVRFPADVAHVFEAVTPVASLFVCTTAPQPSMAGGERWF